MEVHKPRSKRKRSASAGDAVDPGHCELKRRKVISREEADFGLREYIALADEMVRLSLLMDSALKEDSCAVWVARRVDEIVQFLNPLLVEEDLGAVELLRLITAGPTVMRMRRVYSKGALEDSSFILKNLVRRVYFA